MAYRGYGLGLQGFLLEQIIEREGGNYVFYLLRVETEEHARLIADRERENTDIITIISFLSSWLSVDEHNAAD